MALSMQEYFHCYRCGWKHGACANAKDPKFAEHADEGVRVEYNRGYDRGRAAAMLDASDWCERNDYDPKLSILRKPAPIDPPK
jgi:hypothetical protein